MKLQTFRKNWFIVFIVSFRVGLELFPFPFIELWWTGRWLVRLREEKKIERERKDLTLTLLQYWGEPCPPGNNTVLSLFPTNPYFCSKKKNGKIEKNWDERQSNRKCHETQMTAVLAWLGKFYGFLDWNFWVKFCCIFHTVIFII